MSKQIDQALAQLTTIIEKQNKRAIAAQRNDTLEELIADCKEIEPTLESLINAQSLHRYENEELLAPRSADERVVTIAKFTSWLQKHAPESKIGDVVEIKTDIKEGSGVFALRDIDADELIISIPRKVMMTFDSALRAPIGDLIKRSQMLVNIRSLAVALHLLYERLNPMSFWRPYIDSLPTDVYLPFCAPLADIELLKGSANYLMSLRQYKNTVRQYLEVHSYIQQHFRTARLQPFSFVAFRWAMMTVMARQNQIPAENHLVTDDGRATMSLALIPGFDMLNHAYKQGAITTHFDIDTQTSDTITPEAVTKGSQVYIFYGDRPNSLLFQYQGFIAESMSYDRVVLPMVDFDTTEQLYKIRMMLLTKFGLLQRELAVPFNRTVDMETMTPPKHTPVHDWRDAWKIVRVMTMNKEELSAALTVSTRIFKECSPNSTVTSINELIKTSGVPLFQDDCDGEVKRTVSSVLIAHLEGQLGRYAADTPTIPVTGESSVAERFRHMCVEMVTREKKMIADEIDTLRKNL